MLTVNDEINRLKAEAQDMRYKLHLDRMANLRRLIAQLADTATELQQAWQTADDGGRAILDADYPLDELGNFAKFASTLRQWKDKTRPRTEDA